MHKLLPSAAYFEGHFPGRPILPGVTQLALVAQAMTRRGGALSAVRHVRLRQLVIPGEELLLTTRAVEDGRVRFELKRGASIVTNGELTLSESLSDWEDSNAPASANESDHPPIETLLPHRSPMRFVERVFERTDERIVCEASIPSACPLVCEGAAPAIVAIEAAAQAAAVGEALRRIVAGARDAAPSGYLVSLRDIELAVATIPVDAPLIVVVRLQSMALPLSTYAVDAFHRNRPVLRGRIGTFLADA